jgi:Xaa-Pro dipeptidase
MADYELVLEGKYPAKEHAKRVVEHIRTKVPEVSGVIYLEGRMSKLMEDTDQEEPFRSIADVLCSAC